jgi:NAD(P)-dependent dehydrogenase (short-subunit alcohol dehydrogenase family)
MLSSESHRDKVAVVTGSRGGLGKAMVHGLLSAGATVIGVDIGAPDSASEGSVTEDGRLLTLLIDITSEDSAKNIVNEAMSRFGRVDILVNNAGLNLETIAARTGGDPVFKTLQGITPEAFRQIFEVNTIAPFLLARAVVGPMMDQGWGRIIGVTTSLDTMIRKGMIPYGGSKAAHEAFMAVLAKELEGTGVTANILVPGGPANTPMTTSFGTLQAKLISPDVMVKPLLWLTSPEADTINGKRFLAAMWNDAIPAVQAAEHSSAPAAWPQLGQQAIRP